MAATFAFGYAVATDATEWHKGDTCCYLGRDDAPRCPSRSKAKVNCFLHASPQNNIICSFGGPDNTMDVGARTQKEPVSKDIGSKSGGYLLSHNMQYHRRCCLSALCPRPSPLSPAPARRRRAHRRPPRASEAGLAMSNGD